MTPLDKGVQAWRHGRKAAIRKAVKHAVAALPRSAALEYLVALPRLREWESKHARGLERCNGHDEFWRSTAAHVREPALYLEFGVASGRSMRWWSGRLRHPDTRLVGFDTFQGLPEAWGHAAKTTPAGTFSTGGRPPEIDDKRASFVTGMFQESLPGFMDATALDRQLLVHLDADLYSSTLYVLTKLDPWLPGAVVMFDEFSSITHEFRALADYCSAYRRSYETLAVQERFDQVAVRFA